MSRSTCRITGLLTIYREQEQLARENPISAAALAAAAQGGTSVSQNNIENLLDIDFDGAAPASLQKQPTGGASGLEGLAGTPQRVESPAVSSPQAARGNMDDLMGIFGNGSAAAPTSGGFNQAASGGDDLMNGFAGLDMGGGGGQPPPSEQHSGPKKTNDDILGLF
jgi:AP-1 complex subunit beta-1